jgi:putative membrane protein
MKKFLKMVLINALSLWIITVLFKRTIYFSSTMSLIVTAAVLGLLNSTLKPILKFISLPFSILTLGLFSLLINGFVFWLALYLGGGQVSSIVSAILASVILSITNSGFSSLMDD